MSRAGLQRLAARPRPTTVGGVIERLEIIEAELSPRDGVAVFTRMYRWTTERVAAGLAAGRFEAGDDMAELDVVFAGLYFDAVDAWARSGRVPGAWRPLFDRNEDRRIVPMTFALAGMNAHINRDLAVALVRTARGRLREDSPQFRDYEVINTVLAETSDEIRDRILPPALIAADSALGEVDDRLVLRAIITERRAAWEVAQRLQAVAPVRPAFDAAVAVLDTSVGATVRAVLDPSGAIGA